MFHKGGDGKSRGFGFSGFAIAPRGTAPETHFAQIGLGMSAATRGGPLQYGKKRVKSEEE